MKRVQPDESRADIPSDRTVRLSSRFSNELVNDARSVFEDEMGKPVSAEEARQMLENLAGFFMILHEWDREQAKRDAEDVPPLK